MHIHLGIQERSKAVLQQEFGHMRTVASQLAHENPHLDEEEIFDKMCMYWLKGLKTELVKTIGVGRAKSYLDPFHGISRKTR